MLNCLEMAARFLETVARWIVMSTLVGIVLCVLHGIVTRNMSVSITFLEELSRYLQVWFVSAGAALALRLSSLPATELVKTLLPAAGKRVLDFCNHCLMLAFVLAMLYFGRTLILHLVRTGQRSPNLGLPMYVAYAGIYVGYAMFAVFILSDLADIWRGRGKFARPAGPGGDSPAGGPPA